MQSRNLLPYVELDIPSRSGLKQRIKATSTRMKMTAGLLIRPSFLFSSREPTHSSPDAPFSLFLLFRTVVAWNDAEMSAKEATVAPKIRYIPPQRGAISIKVNLSTIASVLRRLRTRRLPLGLQPRPRQCLQRAFLPLSPQRGARSRRPLLGVPAPIDWHQVLNIKY